MLRLETWFVRVILAQRPCLSRSLCVSSLRCGHAYLVFCACHPCAVLWVTLGQHGRWSGCVLACKFDIDASEALWLTPTDNHDACNLL